MDNDFEQLRGEVIDGKLRLDDVIGNGEKCVLFCGTHLLLNRLVAVKVFAAQDAEFIAQGSKQNMRESQSLQKVLATGTSGEIGYAVFEFNSRLSEADLVRAYRLNSLSASFVEGMERARAERKRRGVVKVAIAALLLVGAVCCGVSYAGWVETNSVQANAARLKLVQSLADRMNEHNAMLAADLPALLQVQDESKVVSHTLEGVEREAYRQVAARALQFAKVTKRNDPNAARDAMFAALHLWCLPGCTEPSDLRGLMVEALNSLGDERRPDLLEPALEIYEEHAPFALSVNERATLRCLVARQYTKCTRAPQAKSIFDKNLALGKVGDPSALTAAAILELDLHNEDASRALVKEAIQFAKRADVKKDYRVLRQMFVDLDELQEYDTEAAWIGTRVYAVSAADPAWAARVWHLRDVRKVDQLWDMLLLANTIAKEYERQGKLSEALDYYRKARSWTDPSWPADWNAEAKKPQLGIERIEYKLQQSRLVKS